MRYITPEHCIGRRLADGDRPNWDAALMVFRDHTNSGRAADALGARPIEKPRLYNLGVPGDAPLVFEADVAGRKVVVVKRCVWGGPQAAILTEELAFHGVKTIVGYGVSGSIDPALTQGRFIVASSALPNDGTSRSYRAEAEMPADPELLSAVKGAAETLGLDMQPARAATVDALYNETEQHVAEWRELGGQIINLETSALYAAAAARGVRAVWLGYVSDCLVDGQWADWFADMGDVPMQAADLCRQVMTDLLTQT